VVDAGVAGAGLPLIGYANYLLVWGSMHQWGFAWQDGTLTRARWRLVTRLNSTVMTVYLWHMVPAVIVAVALYPTAVMPQPVGFQNSATGADLGFYAARSYSLMRPPRTGRRLIRSWERSAAGWSGRGGRSWRLRWGRRPL
jgi:hypothetical protein